MTARLAALIASVICAPPALAQDVTLSAPDGSLRIEGTLTGYDSEFYRVETPFGPLTVDATAVVCRGFGCPDLGAYVAQLTIGGDPEAGAWLIPPLLTAYAQERGYTALRRVESDRRSSVALLRPADDSPVMTVRIALGSGLDALDTGAADAVLHLGATVPPGRRARGLAVETFVPARPDAPLRTLPVDPDAEGFRRLSTLSPEAAAPLKGACGRVLSPSRTDVKAGDYPLARPIALVTAPRRFPRAVRDWFDWLDGPAAARVIRRAGYADLATEAIPLANQGTRLAQSITAAGRDVSLADLQAMLAGLDGAARLTPTFRFAPGVTRPDALSDGLIGRLSRDLEAGLYDGQELILAGFSDGEGAAAGNRRISERRATVLRDLILARAPLADLTQIRLSPMGFGEALPIACDDTEWGRRINRRVELWTRPLPAEDAVAEAQR